MSGFIQNSGGAACKVEAVAYHEQGNNGTIYYIDLHGPVMAVRAITASIHKSQNLNIKQMTGVPSWRKLNAFDGHFLTMSTRMLDNTEVRAIAVLEPSTTCGEGVICSAFGDSIGHQLYRMLDLYTPYAVHEDWSEQLMMAGERHHLITNLTVSGIEWASAIQLEGWDEAIDELAKSGELAHL